MGTAFPLLKCWRTHYGRHCEPFSGQNCTRLLDFAYTISNFFPGVIPQTCAAGGSDPLAHPLPAQTNRAWWLTQSPISGVPIVRVLRNDHWRRTFRRRLDLSVSWHFRAVWTVFYYSGHTDWCLTDGGNWFEGVIRGCGSATMIGCSTVSGEPLPELHLTDATGDVCHCVEDHCNSAVRGPTGRLAVEIAAASLLAVTTAARVFTGWWWSSTGRTNGRYSHPRRLPRHSNRTMTVVFLTRFFLLHDAVIINPIVSFLRKKCAY